jgi:subtilisin-like proprotein convertase family protein
MRSRPTFWILLALLLAAGAWLFWPSANRVSAGKNSALKQTISAHKKIVTPNSVTVKSASTAPTLFAAGKISTNAVAKVNPFAHRLSNTTKTIGELTDDRHAILLANALIDTDAKLNFSIPKNLQSQGDPGAYIVQADGPIDNAFRALLAAAGAQIVSYIPNNAYLVRMSASGAAEMSGEPTTEAVIPYEPYYKISSSLLGAAVDEKSLPDDAVLTLGLFEDNASQTIDQIEKLGGKVVGTDSSPFGPIVRVQPAADWTALAVLPGVQIVEMSHQRAVANDLARVTLGISSDTVTTNNYLGLSGKNVLVEVNDTGIDTNHPDFSVTGSAESPGTVPPSRIFGDTNFFSLVDTNGHGTHVAGIIAGNGSKSYTVTNTPQGSVTNADFRGKAPAADLYSVAFLDANGDDSLGVSDSYLQEAPARNNALISNNSWNYTDDSEYDLAAASYDAAVRDALPGTTGSQPVLFVFAAGNNGGGADDGGGASPDTILSPATAKDVITVGALEQLRDITNIVKDLNGNSNAVWQAGTDSGTQVAGYSSRGNVGIGTEGTFGRFKPDVVAPGSFVVSTRSEQWDQNAYYNPTNYSFGELIDQIVDTNSPIYSGLAIPDNAVGVDIFVVPNTASPEPFPDLPIYVSQNENDFPDPTDPSTYDLVKFNNQVNIPPDTGGNITGIQSIQGDNINFAVADGTNIPVSYDVITEIVTTNDDGNYFTVLSNLNNTIGPWYRYESGTSMATPAVSGVLALMQDYFTNKLQTVPSPALLKAMLINGSRAVGSYTFAVTNGVNDEGWGLANLTNSLPLGITTNFSAVASSFFLDQNPTNALATGDSHTFNVTVTASAQSLPLRVTLAWTDPPGNPAAAIKLVNNLDLVVSNNTTHAVYFGNDIAPGNTFNLAWNTNSPPNLDAINNVENVFLSSASGTNYSVTVIGRDVNVNAVTAQTNNVVQDYALVISSGNGQVTNALTVSPPVIVLNPTTDQDITVVSATNTPLLDQFVGASSPLLGTNTVGFTTNSAYATNALLTIGQTNQWHFYIVTNSALDNSGSSGDVTNAAFVTFLPNTLSIPREGVFADSDANSTRPEADIDLFVTTDSNLLTLSPNTISNCINGVQQVGASTNSTFNGVSLGRGGTEFVVDTNSQHNQVYYIAVQSEDQQASEYGFLPVFTSMPFSTLNNGNQTVNGLLLPVTIPDASSPSHPGVGYVFALAIYPMDVDDVTVSNQIVHQRFGDLVGALNHNDISDVLNNRDKLGNPPGPYDFIYDDSGEGLYPGSQPSDGPGSLRNFTGTQGIGPWILAESDNALGATGEVTGLTLVITPHQDLKQPGVTVNIGEGQWFYGYIDVPVGYTNLTISATNVSKEILNIQPASPPLQLFVEQGSLPTLADTNGVSLTKCPLGDTYPGSGAGDYPGNFISTGPPLTPGRYFVGIYNPSSSEQEAFVIATLGFSPSAKETLDFASSGSVTILDDAVTTSSITVPNTDTIQDFNVGLRVDHPRISDLVFHLISPDGTRYLLMENRGGTSANCGATVTTAFSTNYDYLAFTEDTNLTTTPIKFAPTPFVPLNQSNLYYLPEQDISALDGQSAAGTWTLEIQDDRAGAGLTNSLVSWELGFTFANIITPLTNTVPETNVVPADSITWFSVSVPTNADFATNILLFATAPVNLWFSTNSPPTTDVELLNNSTGGMNVLSAYGGSPLLVPGTTYYLGVQNTNSVAVTNALEVDFHFLSASSGIFISSIVSTNISGTNGFLLTWFAPSNDLFQVQWTGDLTPPQIWDTFTNIVSYNTNVPVGPTNAQFNFFDDGSQTGGFDPNRFYRLILLGSVFELTSTNNLPLTNSLAADSTAYFLVNVPTNADFATNILDFASAPVNMLFNQTAAPTGTNAGDFILLTNSTGGIGIPVLATNSAPPLVPGETYYLAVQNTNSFAVNIAAEVDFHLVTNSVFAVLTNAFSLGAITSDGTNLYFVGAGNSTNYVFELSSPLNTNSAFSIVYTNVDISTSLNGLTAPDTNLFWIDPNANPPPSGGTVIFRGDKNSGPITPYDDPGTIFDGSDLASDGSQLFAVDYQGGKVARLGLDFSYEIPIGASRYFSPERLNTLTVANGTVYVADSVGSIVSLSTNGGSYTTLFAGAPFISPNGITVSGGALFVVDAAATNTIWELPISGGTPTALVSGPPFNLLSRITYLNHALYVTDNNISGGTIFRILLPDSTPVISGVSVTTTNVTLNWADPIYDQFQVQWTTNLVPVVVWSTFPDVIVSTNGNFTFTDTNAPLSMKFYRLIESP